MRNFLSYGNNTTVLQLERPGTTLIVGEDLDNTTNGQGANGVGKSALINALAYAIYDRSVSNISKDNLVNNTNKKNMEVVVNFVMPNSKVYAIKRSRKTRAGATGNTVLLEEDGKDITPDSAANTNALIEQIIGIPYELFVRIVVFSASHTPFLDLPVKSHYQANQTDIIEELFGLTALSAKANALREIIKETENRIAMRQVKIETLEKEHVRHQQQIDSAKRRVVQWDEQNQLQVKLLRAKLKKIEKVDIEQQRSLHETLNEVNGQLTDVLDKQRMLDKHAKELIKVHQKAEGDLVHLRDEKCPYCLQEFVDAKAKIKETEKTVEKTFKEIELNKGQLDTIKKEVETLTGSFKDTKEKITVDNVEELLQIRNESDTIRTKIDEMEKAVNPLLDPLEELQALKIDKIDYDEINKLNKELDHQRFLHKLLTKKDSFVRKALLNKNIPYLNARLQHYLTILGLPHKVEFTHEMTAAISQFGRELDFGNLSAGQRARVNLALSFAFRDVLQSLYTKINICMLDEILDIGLDTVGVQAASRLLKRKARDEQLSLYIISHRDEIDGAFDNTMTVQLSKGFSYIKDE
jgi:DNA repair exonuclease SbcCD ATPase subunit